MSARTQYLPHCAPLEEIPAPIVSEVRRFEPELAFRVILVIPPQQVLFSVRNLLHRLSYRVGLSQARILFFADRQLLVATASPGRPPAVTGVPHESIIRVEATTKLLRAGLIVTRDCDGRARDVRVDYNAVAEQVIRREVDHARCRDSRSVAASHPRDDPLGATAPLKFRNYLRRALLPGDTVRAAVYEPPVRRTTARLAPMLSPKRALAVTGREIIVLEDERKTHEIDYGTVLRVFPLRSVLAASWARDDVADWLTLATGTPLDTASFRYPLSAGNAERLRAALA